ncbi:MAG: hypothetical protein HY482_00035 [Candidatus Wildermuthbacteria bacterium]|nr:hypothetical protein [Candidatus Wildermuthbacteria bacterium]
MFSITFVAIAVYALFFRILLRIQEFEIKDGVIPDARPHDKRTPQEGFLHIQSYYTTTLGNALGLAPVNAFLLVNWSSALAEHAESYGIYAILAVFALFAGLVIHVKHLSMVGHRPNWAYPKTGDVSVAGMFYALYFPIQLWVVAVALTWIFWEYGLELPGTGMALAGLGFYAFTVFMDVWTRRWAWLG